MKIDVTQPLKNLDGTSITFATATCPECGQITEGQPLTLRLACTRALVNVTNNAQKVKGEDSVARYALAMRIYEEDEPDLKAEEIALVKQLVSSLYASPLVVGQVWQLLDP